MRAFYVAREGGIGDVLQPKIRFREPAAALMYASMAAAVSAGLMGAAESVRREMDVVRCDEITWSWRFWPTTGKSLRTSKLWRSRVFGEPTPHTISSWGDWNAPAETIFLSDT